MQRHEDTMIVMVVGLLLSHSRHHTNAVKAEDRQTASVAWDLWSLPDAIFGENMYLLCGNILHCMQLTHYVGDLRLLSLGLFTAQGKQAHSWEGSSATQQHLPVTLG